VTRYVYDVSSARAINVGAVTGYAVTETAGRSTGDVALLTVRGRHGKVKDLVSDRFYVITEGTGEFIIEGLSYPVAQNDVVVIPPNTSYDFSGEMKLVVFCSPPFDLKNDISLE
jgi:mannose-6-phosphate isomerase-like protein (cupin superfamily)